MNLPPAGTLFRFGVFEADSATGELRRKGVRVRLHAQPFQLLILMLQRPGELLTREEISRELWPDGTFVDFEHGVNSAVNRLREALGDKAANPRFVETLARRGYRFIAPVERVGPSAEGEMGAEVFTPETTVAEAEVIAVGEPAALLDRLLAQPEDLPPTSPRLAQVLFLLLQGMYLGFYVGALANLGEISQLLGELNVVSAVFELVIVTAALLIPVRIFLACAVMFRAPGLKEKFLRLWPFLLLLDAAWALAPFLLLHHISYGLALACAVILLYAPFAQRSLMLMLCRRAGQPTPATDAAAG